MEYFYILKDELIQEEKGVVDVRNGESFVRHTMTIRLSSYVVSALIGKNGVGMEKIRELAYSKITILTNNDNKDSMTTIVFEGDKLGIPQAFYLVMNRILALKPRWFWIYPSPRRMSYLTTDIKNSNSTSRSDDFSLALFQMLNPNLVTYGYPNDSEEYE